MVPELSICGLSDSAMDAAQKARCKEMLDQILAMATKMASDLAACNAELKACGAAFQSAPPAFDTGSDSIGREVDPNTGTGYNSDVLASNLVTLPSASLIPSPISAPPHDADPDFDSCVTELSYICDPPISTGGGLCVLLDADDGNVDRLSRFPDSLLRNIVARLPVKDAGRTVVLSRRWSPIWRAAPLLVGCADHAVLHLNSDRFYGLVPRLPDGLLEQIRLHQQDRACPLLASNERAFTITTIPSDDATLHFQFEATELFIASPTRCSTLRLYLYLYGCVPKIVVTCSASVTISLYADKGTKLRPTPWPSGPWVFARVFRTWVLLVSPLSLLRPPDTSSFSCKLCRDGSCTLTFDRGIRLLLSASIVMSMKLPGSIIDTLNGLCALLLKVASSLSAKEKGQYPRKKELMSMLKLDKCMTAYLEEQLLCTLLKIPWPPPHVALCWKLWLCRVFYQCVWKSSCLFTERNIKVYVHSSLMRCTCQVLVESNTSLHLLWHFTSVHVRTAARFRSWLWWCHSEWISLFQSNCWREVQWNYCQLFVEGNITNEQYVYLMHGWEPPQPASSFLMVILGIKTAEANLKFMVYLSGAVVLGLWTPVVMLHSCHNAISFDSKACCKLSSEWIIIPKLFCCTAVHERIYMHRCKATVDPGITFHYMGAHSTLSGNVC